MSKFISDYDNLRQDLRIIRIQFGASKDFERIIKDRAVKPVDMLADFGGTIGFWIGFSIISGVEIIYFATKIVVNVFSNIFNRINHKRTNK